MKRAVRPRPVRRVLPASVCRPVRRGPKASGVPLRTAIAVLPPTATAVLLRMAIGVRLVSIALRVPRETAVPPAPMAIAARRVRKASACTIRPAAIIVPRVPKAIAGPLAAMTAIAAVPSPKAAATAMPTVRGLAVRHANSIA